jgi:PAS domain S-box-containing protein
LKLRGFIKRFLNVKASQEQGGNKQSPSDPGDVARSNKVQLVVEPSTDSGEMYKSLVNHVGIGVFRTTPGINGRFLEVNPAMAEITGYSREELLQMNVTNLFVHPEERAEITKQVLVGELKEGKEVIFRKKDGTIILVRDKKVAVTSPDGHAIYFEGFLENITEQKHMEARIRKLNDTLELIRNIHQLIVRSDNERELLQQGCDRLVKGQRYPLAWIGFIQEHSYSVLPVAQAGSRTDYLASVEVTWDESPAGQGPVGTAIKTGKTCLIEDTLRDSRCQPWKEKSIQMGFNSVLALPLVIQDKVIGVLTIYSSTVNDFDNEEINLLVELADDLSLGIDKIRQKVEKQKVEQVLADELTRRRVLIDQSKDGIVILDQDGAVFEANRRFSEMIGYSPEETQHLRVWDWEYQLAPEVTRQMIQTVDDKGNHFESKHKRKDGSIYDVEISSNAAIFAGKKLIFCVCRDISERKKIEEELSRRAMLLDAASDGILLHDLEGNILYANETMCREHDLKLEQMLHLDNLDRVITRLEPLDVRVKKMRQSGLYTIELERLDRNGSSRSIEIHSQIVRIGEKDLILVISRDISERKQAEILYRTLAEDSPLGIYFSQNGVSIFTNNAFQKATGFSKEDLLGRSSLELVHPDDCPRVRESAIAMLKGNSAEPYQFRYLTKTGETRWALERVSSITYRGQRAVLGNFMDITEIKRSQEALREAMEKYDNLVNNVGIGVFVSTAGTPGKFVQVNQEMEHITGYTREELLKINVEDTYIDSADRERKLEAFMRDGPVVPIERMLKRKDGSLAITRSWLTATKSSSGEVIFYEVIMEDITERRKMEEALRFSDAAFHSIQEGIFATDMNLVVTRWNNICENIFGVKAEDAIGKRINQVVLLVEDSPGNNYRREQSLFSKGYDHEEQLYRTPFGDRWLDVHTQAIEFEGKRSGWVTLITDVTERKKVAEALTKSEEKLRLMFRSVNDGIAVIDLKGVITDTNQAMINLLGLNNREEVVGKSVLDFVSPDYRESIQADLQKDPREELLYKKELVILRYNGQNISVEVSAGLLKDISNSPIGSVITVRDVTETRKIQQQLLAQDRLASIGQLVSGIAHEINNPLTTIIGFSQLVLEQELPEGLKENISMVYKEAQRTARIVKDLLTFARKHIPVKQMSDINRIIEDVLRLRDYDEKINNIEVVRELDPNLPQIMVDYYQMQQVFLNIIINAEYFMTATNKCGKLTVKTEKSGSLIRISITDNGPGIPKENLSRIFDPFFTTKEVGKGTGLGLSICHGIVTEHSGKIYAESDLGKGTTFIVKLPIDTGD